MPILPQKRIIDTPSYKLWSWLEKTKKKFNIPDLPEKKIEGMKDIKTIVGQGLAAVGEIAGDLQMRAATPKPLEKWLLGKKKSPAQIFKERAAFVGEERELRKRERLLRPVAEREITRKVGSVSRKEFRNLVNHAVAERIFKEGIFTTRPNTKGGIFGNFLARGASYGVFDGYASDVTEMARLMKNPYTKSEVAFAGLGALTGGLVTYGAVAGRVGAAMKTIPQVNKFAAAHPYFFGASIQNLGEEAIDFTIRRTSGQTYTKTDFFLGMGFGASAELFFGSVKGLRDLQLPKAQRQLNNAVETFVREKGHYPDFETELFPRLEKVKIAGSNMTYGQAYQSFRAEGERRLIGLRGIPFEEEAPDFSEVERAFLKDYGIEPDRDFEAGEGFANALKDLQAKGAFKFSNKKIEELDAPSAMQLLEDARLHHAGKPIERRINEVVDLRKQGKFDVSDGSSEALENFDYGFSESLRRVEIGKPARVIEQKLIIRVDGQPQRVTRSDIDKMIKGEPSPFIKRREATLLKERFRAESRGARRAFSTTKRTIKEVQSEAIEYIKTMLPVSERGKLLSAVKNAQDEKGLRRAIDQTNNAVERMNRRDWIVDIKSVRKQKFLDKLPIDEQLKIKEFVDQYALVRPTAKTRALAETIEEQLEAGTQGLTKKALAKVEMAKKPALADLDSGELKGIWRHVNELVEAAKTKKLLDAIETQDQTIAKVQDLEKALGWWHSHRVGRGTWLKRLWFADLEYTTPDRFFDLLDGFKNYKGDMYKTYKVPVDVAYGKFANEFEEVYTKGNGIIVKNKLSKESLERIGIYGLWQRSDGGKFIGREKLELRGIIEPPQLSKEEMEFYNFVRKQYDEMFPRIRETLAKSENRDIKQVDNYWPMITDRKAKRIKPDGTEEEFAMNVKQVIQQNSFNLSKDTEAGFTITAMGGEQGVELNAGKVFLTHMEDSMYFVHMQPVLDKLNRITNFRIPKGLEGAGRQTIREMLGDQGVQYVDKYLATVAKNGAAQGVSSGWTRGMRMLRHNTSLAVMGGNASVAIKQPLALANAAMYVGPHHLLRSLERVGMLPGRKLPFQQLNKNVQFILDSSAELRMRQSAAGEFALYELSKEGIWFEKIPVVGRGLKTARKWAFYPLQKLDSLSAMAVWDASYRNSIKKGLRHSEAVIDADRIVRLTQSSGISKDMPFIIQRGEVARFIHQFQSFYINDWNLIKHDIVASGLLRGGGSTTKMGRLQRRLQATAVAFFMLQAAAIEDWISSGYDWERAQEGGLLRRTVEKIPLSGRAVSFQRFGGTTVPGLDAPLRAGGAMMQMLDPSSSQRVKETAIVNVGAGIGSIAGIPFSGQAFKTIRRHRREARESKGSRDFSDIDFSGFHF